MARFRSGFGAAGLAIGGRIRAWPLIAGCLALAGMTGLAEARPVGQLPLSADRCAILRALTDRADPGCQAPPRGAPRSMMRSVAGVDKHAALSPGEDGYEHGYFIHFAFDSDQLEDAYRLHLDRLADVLSSAVMQGTCVKLVGHADVVGPDSYNMDLSERRATTVVDYLRPRVDPERVQLTFEGRGETAPIPDFPGDDPIQRRVEILSRPAVEGVCE